MSISIIIPFYNEELNVYPLIEEIMEVSFEEQPLEIMLIDDGSTDNTWTEICKCKVQYPQVQGYRLSKNMGQSAALLHGLHRAIGTELVTMDGDSQNDPHDIPMLIKALKHADVVCGIRKNRRDSITRRIASRLANTIRNWVTHDGIRDTGCSLKAFHKSCLKDLPKLDGMHRFMPAYFLLNERKISEVLVHHRARTRGQSKYTLLKRLPRTLYDLFGFVWYRKRHIVLLYGEESPHTPSTKPSS